MRTYKYFFFLMASVAGLQVGVAASPGYGTYGECVNSELKKHSSPSEEAFLASGLYCRDLFQSMATKDKKALIEKIKKQCPFDYDGAVKAGYTHEEVVSFLEKQKPDCLK
jgi:hypothetical protein